MKDVSSGNVDISTDPVKGAEAAADFGIRLLQSSMAEGENILISPLSVFYALSMTANGADGDTRTQMEAVLGMSTDALNGYMYAYMQQLAGDSADSVKLANSIWIKNDPMFSVNQDFLQANADYYGAGIYNVPFDDSTLKHINRWVSENTDGMIPEMLEEILDEVIMYLINALCFEAKWASEYTQAQVYDETFTTEDGAERDVQMMRSEENLYLEDEYATGFIKPYAGGRYAFAALLPKDGMSISEYVSSLTGERLIQLLSGAENTSVRAGIPKFESGYDAELKEVLQKMGIADAFDPNLSCMSGIGTYGNGLNLYIFSVKHKTFITVGEQGTKAGAATVVATAPERAGFDIPEYKDVILDRPFVYMVIDRQTNLPLFIGTMMDTDKE